MPPAVVELRPQGGRVPPHDLDAEAVVLSAVLNRPDELFDMVIGIVVDYMFYSEANKLIFGAVTAMRAANDPVDVVSVARYLRGTGKLDVAGGTPYLAELTDKIPTYVTIGSHAESIRNKWQARQLIIECQRYSAEAYTSGEPALEIIQRAESSLAALTSTAVATELLHVGTILESEVRTLRELRESGQTGKGTGISTGFSGLDRYTGGLHKTDLNIVAGRPGMGKSAFAMNIAANVARPRDDTLPVGVAFFSLEMPRDQVAIRFVCAEGNVRVAKVRQNDLGTEEWLSFQRAATELSAFPIWIDDTPSVSVFDVRTKARKLQRDIASGRSVVPCSELGLIVVDYLQLMRGIRGPNDTREGEVASLSRGLKELAKSLNVPIVAVSQLNRTTEKKGKDDRRPELSDLRESGAIEQDADSVFFVYRPEYYDADARAGDAELIIRKQRNGALGTVPLAFRGESTRFMDREPDTYDDLSEDFT